MDDDALKSIRDVSTPILKAMRGLCPTKKSGFTGLTICMTRAGEPTTDNGATLTYETRQRINAELKRRKEADDG